MKNDKELLYELDDIGFIGIPNSRLSADDRAFYAQKAEEARAKYRTEYRQLSTDSQTMVAENRAIYSA